MVKINWHKAILNCLLLCFFLSTLEPVFAVSCDGILTQDAADFLGKIINWVRILAPALLIVLGAVDIGSVVISEDRDNVKKATSKFIKRCICAIAIFFVPLIVKVLLDISGITGTLVDDPMCGIEEVGG